MIERRERYPDLHVYHYAPYEPTAMKRLMGLHATREDEVDDLLRENVLVDLYRVVEQALRISPAELLAQEGRGVLHGAAREASVTDGEDSILMFEEWLDSGDQALLDAIEEYNDEDCHSTLLLRDWLLERRAECERAVRRRDPVAPARRGQANRRPSSRPSDEVVALHEALLDGRARRVRPIARPRRALALAAGPAARLPPPRGQAGLVGVLLALREDPRRSCQTEDTEALGGLEPTGEPRAAAAAAALADLHALVPRPGAQDRDRAASRDPFSAGARPRDRRARPVLGDASSTSSACSTTRALIEIRRGNANAATSRSRAR